MEYVSVILSSFYLGSLVKKTPAFSTKGVKEKAGAGMENKEIKDFLLNTPHEDFVD
jgi:hypothetical protein